MKVLVAEDNEDSRNLLVKVIRAYGHEAAAAANGVEALEQALKEPPDILVSDILMPKMDGFQLCHACKQNERLKNIPFVFYTATYTTEEDEKFALSLGANTFIRKPTEPDIFIQKLNEVFEKAKSGLLAPPEVTPLEPSLYLTEYNKRIVAKLEEKVSQLEEAEEKLRHTDSVLRAVRSINQLIVREKDRAKILQSACEMLIEVGEYKFAWIGIIEEGHKRVLSAARAGVEEDYLNSLRITWDDSKTGKGPTGTAIKTRQPYIVNNIPEESRYEPWRGKALEQGYVSLAAIPMVHDEKVYGALNVYSSQRDGFDDEEVQLLVALSDDIAFALRAINIEEECKQAEEALRETYQELEQSEQQYRGLVENINDGYLVVQNQRVVFANQRAADMVGYTLEEGIGGSIQEFLVPEVVDEVVERYGRRLHGETVPRQYETTVLKRDGTKLPVELGTKLMLYKDSPAISILVRDITERKKAEEKLEESEERYRLLFQTSPDAIAQMDREGRFLAANPVMSDRLSISVGEMIGRRFSEVVPKEVAQRRLKLIRKALDKGRIQIFEDEREGKYFHNIVVPIKIPGQEGTVQVISRDITERKKAKEALEHSFIDLAETVSRATASRDPYTAGHERRVAELAKLVGEKMGLDRNRLKGLYIGGLLHDIGKISTPEVILTKPGKLSSEEWALVQSHARQGYEILDGANFPWPIADMTLHHHERLNGSGYPHGISGDEISLENRILGVCDVVEAMSSHRPYRPARSKEEVLKEIKGGRGTKYDVNVVDVMLQIIKNGEFDFGWGVEA